MRERIMSMNKQAFLNSAGVQVEILDFWLEQRWLIPEQTAEGAAFSDIDLARAHFITDLKAGLGVNDEGVDVILHLVDQLHGLRRALEQAQRNVGAT
jgi:chaperone modulatory protein CbpM